MSDEQQSNVNSQQEQEEDEQQNSEQEEQDDDEQDQEQQDQDDQQQGSGDDDDQDEDGSGDQDEQQQGSGEDEQQQQSKQQQQQEENKKLPTFKMINRQQPQQFKFTSLLSEISNLSCSVDNFIGTLHTSADSGIPRRSYSNNYVTQDNFYQTKLENIKVPQPPAIKSRVVIMKDSDAQVDMKPQIIIQPTKPVKQEPIIQAKPYKISTQSEKFLSQLYQENKKLKRWQVNPTHPMNSYMTSFANSNGFTNSSKGFYNSKDKFQRKQYEKGLFNVQQRNKQIDEAIMMLKRQEQEQY